MRRTPLAGLLLALLALGAAGCFTEVPLPPGTLAPADPVQQKLKSAPVFRRDGYVVRPLARFRVTALVLAAERYRFDRGADLAPVDFALGWGPMSDRAVLRQVAISQGGRFYRWRVKKYPIPRRDIIEHSANMHMIPADDGVRAALLAVRPGELVHLEGYLVSVTSDEGWMWKSSLTRTDTGDGACELIWVERIASYDATLAETSF